MRPGKLLQTKLDAAKRLVGARRVVTGDDSVYCAAKGRGEVRGTPCDRSCADDGP